MTVKDLIEKLSKCDPDKVVIVSDQRGWANLEDVAEDSTNVIITIDENALFDD